ncbi:phosphoribosylamine--glycine ligase [Chitinimonas arctica]|uniref:phosphoribosylamine--glycine ligase n=1 Tax=Chitinimonas arctica TaxID=2594795 RepID=A0A516SCC5_9NEIS|nr:phosphoribosylamine--glycine ligase [Chitinimonas arctica]QDQ25801.1 phosphoribosylamine--glycine ligase [Chitinimonas arctica]
MQLSRSAAAAQILVVDCTGRGHAICDLLIRTDPNAIVFYGPGCELIDHPRIIPVSSISLTDPRTALAFLSRHAVDFVFVANIDALSSGYVDTLRQYGYPVIGPSRATARLESSKDYGKRFCNAHGLPTAPFRTFTDPFEAGAYIRALPYPCVVKADGLRPDGDGTVICGTPDEALTAVAGFARQSGSQFRVVVEKRLYGEEISVFALLDGDSYLLFPTAADFKRSLEEDAGKHCDGMGSISPHPLENEALREEIHTALMEPLLAGLRHDRLDFSGFVYISAMLTEAGLRVLEINTRFGDSEAEAVLPSVQNNFTMLCHAILTRSLHGQRLRTDGRIRCSVALTQGCLDRYDPAALPGWPFGNFAVGQLVHGLGAVDHEEATLFYAGLKKDHLGRPISSGGRVLHVVGCGDTLSEAMQRTYSQVGRIAFRGMRYRVDIGARLLQLRQAQPELAGVAD